MEANLAVPAKSPQKSSPKYPDTKYSRVERAAAELYAKGWSRHSVARRLEWHLLTERQRTFRPTKRRMLAMRRCRNWERKQAFRDLVWQYALEITDAKSGAILNGLAKPAINGRVDAAKVALELSGRYTPRGAEAPTAVQIVVNGVPRPPAVVAGSEVVDGAVLLEEEDEA